MNLLKRVWLYLRGNATNLIFRIAVIGFIIFHLQYRMTTGLKVDQLINLYGKVNFDVNNLPNGLVIYKSDSSFLDESSDIKYYEIGIWDYSKDYVHYVRVPHYAHARFVVGMEIRIQEAPKENSQKLHKDNGSPLIQV